MTQPQPLSLSLPIFMFLGRNSAVPALVWGDHRAGSACTDLGSGPTPPCPAAFRDGPHPHLAPTCFCSAGVSFPSSLTEREVERSLWGQSNDGVFAVTNQRPMGRGWKQDVAPPEAGAAFKGLSIKQWVRTAVDNCKSFEKEEITSIYDP